ncbi:MAG TPA: YraN family protein [Chromatiales bacterium]|nr:YraN family protein [Thiotrichales bacterium]HIP69071.1 YraN family protein [Chromatiales bacterium]
MRLKRKGDRAENLALKYLKQAGLKLVTRNYHCRQGEIDLIMEEGEYLVFVEVRYRKNSQFGGAVQSVDWHKQQKIIACAKQYLQNLNKVPACRFDVLAIEDKGQVEWLRNAFEV